MQYQTGSLEPSLQRFVTEKTNLGDKNSDRFKTESASEKTPADSDHCLRIESTLDIDVSPFDANRYIELFNKKYSLSKVLEYESDIIKDIQTIDNDRLRLGHDNYEKFIRPGLTFTNIKEGLEKLNLNLIDVEKGLSVIQHQLKRVYLLGKNKSRIEALVESKSLCDKIGYLFEMPIKIRGLLFQKDYQSAVKYFLAAKSVLSQCGHDSSVVNILSEFSDLKLQLKSTIRTKFQECCKELEAPMIINQCKNLVDLLKSLNESHIDLCNDFLHQCELNTFKKWLTTIEKQIQLKSICNKESLSSDNKGLHRLLNSQVPMNIHQFAVETCVPFWYEISRITKIYTSVFIPKDIQCNVDNNNNDTLNDLFSAPTEYTKDLNSFVLNWITRFSNLMAERVELELDIP